MKRYGDFTAVDDVSFAVERGEIFAFLGPNGAGKTTTIKMLTTLLSPTSGTVELDGMNPARQANEVRKRFGIVFQDPSLDDELTAWENMDFHGVLYHVPRAVRVQRTEELLRLFELWERRDHFVKNFSGGMKRRLDPQTRNQLWKHVQDLNEREKVTVFLTTHYMDEADRVAQRIAIIDHGKIVAQGTPAELKRHTECETLEQTFLALTGSTIREEESTSMDRMRNMSRLWKPKGRG